MPSLKTVKEWVFPAGLVVGIISIVLSYLWRFVPGVQVTFTTFDVRAQIVKGLGTGVGDKVASFFQGVSFPNPALVLITAAAITVVGALALELFKFLPLLSKSPAGQFAGVIFYGSIITAAVLSRSLSFLMSIPFIVVLILYALLAGWATAMVFENVLKRQMPPLPR